MIQALLGLALRHGLTMLGAVLVSKAGLEAPSAEGIIGGLGMIAGVGLSALNKVKVVAKLNAAADSFQKLNK